MSDSLNIYLNFPPPLVRSSFTTLLLLGNSYPFTTYKETRVKYSLINFNSILIHQFFLMPRVFFSHSPNKYAFLNRSI